LIGFSFKPRLSDESNSGGTHGGLSGLVGEGSDNGRL
jgi:hypothetical protein